jgi:UDP-N-acetylglucosamine:LPS N-acetylglucosamine transferase
MPNILYFSSVIGGGHVFRDLAIGRALRDMLPEGHDVVFASGGNAFEMIKLEGERVERIAAFDVKSNGGALEVYQLYRDIMRSEYAQFFDLRRLIAVYEPVLIVLDEFFFLADYCRLRKIPTVFICDFIGVPRAPLVRGLRRAALERFYDWFLASWLPRRTARWIFTGDPGAVPYPRWVERAARNGINTVEPITKLQYSPPPSREEARRELGFAAGDRVVTVAVGCSGTGAYLLEAVAAAAGKLAVRFSNLRLELVCGLGIDPARFATVHPTVRPHGYRRDYERLLAASDAAVVQSGLTTATECLMLGVPSLVVSLEGFWEQEKTARFMERTAGARWLHGSALSPGAVADALTTLLDGPRPPPLYHGDGHTAAARLIAAELRAATGC